MNIENPNGPRAEIEDIDRALKLMGENLDNEQFRVEMAEKLLDRNAEIIKDFNQKKQDGKISDAEQTFLDSQEIFHESYVSNLVNARMALENLKNEQFRRRQELLERRQNLEESIN